MRYIFWPCIDAPDVLKRQQQAWMSLLFLKLEKCGVGSDFAGLILGAVSRFSLVPHKQQPQSIAAPVILDEKH